MAVTRRLFLHSCAALTALSVLPGWLADPLLAQAQAPLRRFNAHSQAPEAVASMQAYRRAVEVMKQRPRHDPTSWLWQANIHGYPGGASEFELAFPSAGIPGVSEQERLRLRALAEQTWEQCPHGNVFFLPWHRVYLFFFERMIQDAAGEPDLALPYWNWTANRLLPPAFREPVNDSQAANPLFNATRGNNFNGDANGENAAGLVDEEVDISMLRRPEFDTRLEEVPGFGDGFGPMLEGNPHGQVHVAVSGDMGGFARAARDPVFWTHHGNVDRLWASWVNVPGHQYPQGPQAQEWRDRSHTLIDRDGQSRSLTTAQVLDAASILERGYVYEDLEEVTIVVASANGQPAGEPAVPASGTTIMASDETSASSAAGQPPPVAVPASAGKSQGATLSNKRVNLNLKIDRPELAVPASGATNSRLFLAVKDLVADKPPGDNFAIFINLPDNAEPDRKGRHFAGVINFFGAVKAKDQAATPASGHSGHAGKIDRMIDVTDKLANLRAAGLWDGSNLSITVVPIRGNVDASAQAKIGGVELIRR